MRHALNQLRGGSNEPGAGASRGERALAGLAALICATLLAVAAWLSPDPDGLGTHTQLNLAPCLWTSHVGIPCPTCGMTTAFAHAAEGDLLRSLAAQPMGALLAIGTAMLFWISLYIAVTGSLVGHLLIKVWKPGLIWIIGGLALASWLYKIWAYTHTQEGLW